MQIIQDRRELHRIPELELCLPKTMASIWPLPSLMSWATSKYQTLDCSASLNAFLNTYSFHSDSGSSKTVLLGAFASSRVGT